MALLGLQRGPLAEATGLSGNNNASRESSSPWPEIETGAIAFLLDVRDDFEAGLLRDWVESRKPAGDARPPHSFIKLPKNGTEDLLGAVPEQDNSVWMQP